MVDCVLNDQVLQRAFFVLCPNRKMYVSVFCLYGWLFDGLYIETYDVRLPQCTSFLEFFLFTFNTDDFQVLV